MANKARFFSMAAMVALVAVAGHAEDAPYAVIVGGKPVEVQEMATPDLPTLEKEKSHPYWYAQFDAPGKVEVRVKARAGVDALRILPKKAAIKPMRTGQDEVAFSLVPPCQVAVETSGRHRALIIAANLPEKDVPNPDDPNVVWIGAGRHRRNLKLTSNQTLYLAPGAVVEGSLSGSGTNMVVRGRGAISGMCWGHCKGPGTYMVRLKGSHITVRDVALIGAWSWSLVLDRTENVLVDNVKILGCHVINDDGIDICRSSNVTIRNSFIRTLDDTIAPKWWCENLLVERCILWPDVANAVRLGYECADEDGHAFRNHVYRDIDVLHLPLSKRPPEKTWAHCAIYIQASNDALFENLIFDDIRFDEIESGDVLLNVKTFTTSWPWNRPDAAGRVRGCILRNIHAAHQFGDDAMLVHLEAKDAAHPIEGVAFEDVSGYGRISTVRTSAPAMR